MPTENQGGGLRSIDEYIATFPADIQERLQAVRAAIKAAAPDARERMSYQMPAFALNGNLVYFAAWKNHIGLYPASGDVPIAFKEQLSRYETSKGSVRFPLSEPLPLDLISEIVKFRVAENLDRLAAKSQDKKA